MRITTLAAVAIAAAFVSFTTLPANASGVRCIQYPNQYGGIHTHCFVQMQQAPMYAPPPRYVPRPYYRPRPRCGWDRWNRWHCR